MSYYIYNEVLLALHIAGLKELLFTFIFWVNPLDYFCLKYFFIQKCMCFSISHYPANSGWDTLWKTYSKELCVGVIKEYRSSAEVIACLKSLGLKYDEHSAPNAFDITECFNPGSCHGERLLSFMTGSDKFHESFTPEIRAGMLDLLRRKCSAEKDGKVLFNSDLSCILVHA